MKWKKGKKQADGKVEKCPHCGKPIDRTKADKPRKWHEKTSVTLGIAAGLALVGLGFIHIITGVVSPLGLPFDVALKESFGYRETFVSARKIEALPYTAAKIRYPRGCRVLQLKGYLESGKVFETRQANRLEQDMTRWQAEFENTLGKPKTRWQDRLQGRMDVDGMDPDDARVYNNRGIASAERGQYETAISNFTRASRRDPVFAEAYFNRAFVYLAIGQLGRAIADFGKTVEIRPKLAAGYIERGLIHTNMDQHDEAVADFTKTLEIDPARAEIYLRRSLVCCAVGKYDQAWKDVHKIKSLGLKVPTGYLRYLRAASERQK
ncbi:MAG: tetratricopeptide repeat protein [Planctomycetota bacterium]|jgi:tetratricopeptide (TPR) repeat protein